MHIRFKKFNFIRLSKLSFLWLYLFTIIYMPRISDLVINIEVEYISVALLCIMIFPYLLGKYNAAKNIGVNKKILKLFFGVFISSLYIVIIALITNNDLRFLQNNFIIVQAMHVLIIVNNLEKLGLDGNDILKFVFSTALVQGILCIFMIFIPTFRELALSLYYLNREENIFINRIRIYGISGDYTFFTPAYHGMLATVATVKAAVGDKTYLKYIPFLLIAILLNGRIGLIVFACSTAIAILLILVRTGQIIRIAKISIYFVNIMVLSIVAIYVLSPNTFKWILNGFESTILYIVKGEKTGNYIALADSMISFPDGIGFIFGYGHRIIGDLGRAKGFYPSDIGFINDMYLGGIMYISVLYGSILIFFSQRLKKNIDLKNRFNEKILSLVLIISLLITNFKGEAMRGGSVLLGAFLIKIIITKIYSEEVLFKNEWIN